MSGIHPAHVFNSLQQLLVYMECEEGHEEYVRIYRKTVSQMRKFWTRRWNQHVEKHGNVPMIMKCDVCSGKEQKEDIKRGKYKESRPTKKERDELKGRNES